MPDSPTTEELIAGLDGLSGDILLAAHIRVTAKAAASRLEALTAENKDAEDRVAAWKIQAKAWEDDARSRMAEIESLTSRLARVEGAAKAALRPQPDAYEAALEYPLKFWHEWVAEIRSGDLSDMPRMQFEAAMDEYAEARLAPLKSLSDPEGTP